MIVVEALLGIETIKIGSFQLTGGNTVINLVAAGTNAPNGAILASSTAFRSSARWRWR